jgi:class 3 adenylate cyclase/pimeloyl-ACP methyl ester carboxylesterase
VTFEPQIKYARTADGVNIAYYAVGQGPPFVWLILPNTHLLAEQSVPRVRSALEEASRLFKLVRLDFRGFGLSDREARDISFRAMVQDIETVVDRVGAAEAVVFAASLSVFPAVCYAAAHPDRVARLVLWGAGPDLESSRSPRVDAVRELSGVDWELGAETLVRSFGGTMAEEAAAWASLLREAADPRSLWTLLLETDKDFDATAELQSLRMPALVIHNRTNRNMSPDAARRMAALIPDGHYAEIEDQSGVPLAVARFLQDTGFIQSWPQVPSGTASQTGMTAILFADIADSTALTERLGDDAFRAKARELDGALRAVIRENGGTPVEGRLLGDGVLAVFTSARRAIEAALACGRAGDEAGLPLHLGLHAGDVIREEGNVYGGAVNIAARVSELAAPGEVLVSDIVRGLARTSAGVGFEERWERELKGVGEPVRVWAVREGGAS